MHKHLIRTCAQIFISSNPRPISALADKAWETVLAVDRYARDRLKLSGQVAFHPSRAEQSDHIPHGTLIAIFHIETRVEINNDELFEDVERSCLDL